MLESTLNQIDATSMVSLENNVVCRTDTPVFTWNATQMKVENENHGSYFSLDVNTDELITYQVTDTIFNNEFHFSEYLKNNYVVVYSVIISTNTGEYYYRGLDVTNNAKFKNIIMLKKLNMLGL
jgi:hypothetical protein